MPRPARQKHQTTHLHQYIMDTAWQQIAEMGAPALSLRAIARALSITAPAIYNYFPDRDGLVTALILDAFTSFGDAQIAAIAGIPEDAHASRMRALGLAYRDWAVTYPERYQLIFGTPIAGYVAPLDITMPVAARSLAVLVSILSAAHQAGGLRMDTAQEMTPVLFSMFDAWQQARGAADPHVLILALMIWGQVHGLVSLEIGRQYPPFITNAGEVYRHALESLIHHHLLHP